MPPSASLGRTMVVCVEGNIASGKTTLLQMFKKHASVRAFEEPVTAWRCIRGRGRGGEAETHNLLQLLYDDPKRWSFTFQHYVQLTMLRLHEQPVEEPFKLIERSLHSARHCFVENLYQTEKMTGAEYAVLCEWYDWLCKERPVHPDVIVYLKTDPEVVAERIRRRGRPEEREIPLDYLRALHDLHEKWLEEKAPCPVVTLDGNLSAEEVEKGFMREKHRILLGPHTNGVRAERPGAPLVDVAVSK